MRESDCMFQVGRLLATYPNSKATEATAQSYIDALIGLHYSGALADAVTALIRTERFLPSVSQVIDEYGKHRERHAPKELEQPDPSEEDMALNRRRFAALAAHMTQDGHGATIEECSHPGCAILKEKR